MNKIFNLPQKIVFLSTWTNLESVCHPHGVSEAQYWIQTGNVPVWQGMMKPVPVITALKRRAERERRFDIL